MSLACAPGRPGYTTTMSDPENSQRDGTPDDDTVRQHSQEPAEGPDEDAADREDVPREHAQDPAEG